MDEIDPQQEEKNESSYTELLVGKKQDPTKDPRWHAIRGIGFSVRIMSGDMSKHQLCIKQGFNNRHIINYLQNEIKKANEKKERLKTEIKEKKNGK